MNLEGLLGALDGFRRDGARADRWSLYAVESRRLAVGTKDRETGGPHAPLSIGESGSVQYLIVWSDGRVSHGRAERRELEEAPGELLVHALASRYDDPDAAQVVGPSSLPDVALHDAQVAAVAAGDVSPLEMGLSRLRERVARHAFRTWSGSLSAADSSVVLITSSGFSAEARSTLMRWSATFDGELGGGFETRAAESAESFEKRLDRLAFLADRLRQPGEPPGHGVRPIVLHPSVVEEFVLPTLLRNLDGESVAHGESHFRLDQFGADRPVLREDLTLRLDPLLPLRSGSYRFTTQGVPAAPCVYIDRGRLVTPIMGLKYARRLGRQPTPLPYGLDTLFLEGPERIPLEDALRAADGGAVVLNVLGVHTQDATSGDFSLSAPQTLLARGGAFGGRVRLTLSGNLFESLSDPFLRLVSWEDEHTPGLLIRCRI